MSRTRADAGQKGREQTLANAEVISLLHIPYFLQVRNAILAPRLDRDFYTQLVQYRNLHEEGSLRYRMADAMITSHLRHTWCLTQEVVVFFLFDEKAPARERKKMADALMSCDPPAEGWQVGKPHLPDNLKENQPLHELVGSRSHLLFWLLRAGTAWWSRPVHKWAEDSEYRRVRDWLRDLKVVNDCCERIIQDITLYANRTKDSIHRDEILLVVEDYRFILRELTRKALADANLVD